MKKFAIGFALVAMTIATSATAQNTVRVKPHVRSDGTYVEGHHRTTPNSTRNDNWSTRPNVNPHTGRAGTRDPEPYSPYRPSKSTR